MRRNTEKARTIWQMILDAGREGLPIRTLQTHYGVSQGTIDATLAGMDRYGMRIAELDGRLFAMAMLDKPEQDWEAIKDKNYFWRYR